METEPVAEVTEIRWEAVEDDTWASEVVMTLEIEAAADDIEDTVDEAVALETTCVCFTVSNSFYDVDGRCLKYCRRFEDR